MKKFTDSYYWTPLLAAIAFIGGILCNNLLKTDSGRSTTEKKFQNILNLIQNEYVDVIDVDSLLEETIPGLFSNLDPHSVYISAADIKAVNEELDGSFSGVGIQFALNRDTIAVIEAISGGPAEIVGIKAGDRIIAVDGENVAGTGISNEGVMAMLKGEKGSIVRLSIKRAGAKKALEFDVTRGDIPVTSIDAAYMVTPEIGYVRVNKFGKTTYDEFWQSLNDLNHNGAKDFIIDLRGNTGGFMEMAILMVNELLPAGTQIVYTIGRNAQDDTHVISDGTGAFKNSRVAVLIDEYSASSSEIFAGAIQDNDRGLIIGRRSFGKGLVQRQIDLPDNSAIRLTVARYYTPSGRCIQKDYSDGAAYENDIYERYNHGEAFDIDSVRQNTDLQFTTLHGRTVYGGGGIMPDIFVPNDTIGFTGYFINVANAGLLQRYTLEFADMNRSNLNNADSVDDILRLLPSDDTLLRSFVSFAASNGIPARWYYINISRNLIINQLKALIARDILGIGAYYEIINRSDPTVKKAIEKLTDGDADFPITDRDQTTGNEQI